MAEPGFVLISVDIKQADVRILAQGITTFPRTAAEHVDRLRSERRRLLEPEIGCYLAKLVDHRNPNYRGPRVQPPEYDPARPDALGALLRTAGGDPYTDIAAQISGVPSPSGEVHLEGGVKAGDHSPDGAGGPVREITPCLGATSSTSAGTPSSTISAAAA